MCICPLRETLYAMKSAVKLFSDWIHFTTLTEVIIRKNELNKFDPSSYTHKEGER